MPLDKQLTDSHKNCYHAHGTQGCCCDLCQSVSATWPRYYLGTRPRESAAEQIPDWRSWLSYECYLERSPIDGDDSDGFGGDPSDGWHHNPNGLLGGVSFYNERVTMTKSWAIDEGLTELKPDRNHKNHNKRRGSSMVSGCLLCGGMRLRGEKYCMHCWKVYIQPIEAATGKSAMEFLDPEQPESWREVKKGLVDEQKGDAK